MKGAKSLKSGTPVSPRKRGGREGFPGTDGYADGIKRCGKDGIDILSVDADKKQDAID